VLDGGLQLPRERGTLAVYDALTTHRMKPLLWGQRSALTVYAVGWESIAEAKAAGWPDRWYQVPGAAVGPRGFRRRAMVALTGRQGK
jgi:hypothetical protein